MIHGYISVVSLLTAFLLFFCLSPPCGGKRSVIMCLLIYLLQFFDRLTLFGMPAKHQPDFIYLRHVPLRKVHLFTIIQLSCLMLLWIIKTSRAAIVFPMMVSKHASSPICIPVTNTGVEM